MKKQRKRGKDLVKDRVQAKSQNSKKEKNIKKVSRKEIQEIKKEINKRKEELAIKDQSHLL